MGCNCQIASLLFLSNAFTGELNEIVSYKVILLIIVEDWISASE
jgi:hypothetical protein